MIIMKGAPGTGKTTVSELLHEKLRCPWFEFGWIPEFRHLNPHTEISYEQESQISFENLMLVTQNYLRHGYEQVILSDLSIEQVTRAADVLKAHAPLIITLTADAETICARVRTRDNGNEYRDEEAACRLNARILAQPLLPGEHRIDTTHLSAEDVAAEILHLLQK